MNLPTYDMRPVGIDVVAKLCATHHGYGSCGASATYAWAVFEYGRPVAAWSWQPPPFGAARACAPDAPYGVLALSRMVAVPRDERRLRHVSKPLRRQMRSLIDRTRWPVLVTWHDEGQGHTGHVYLCSGWTRGPSATAPVYEREDGTRVSRYRNGATRTDGLVRAGSTVIHRWEHRACARGEEAVWMREHGWVRVAVPGRAWRSGHQAYRVQRAGEQTEMSL